LRPGISLIEILISIFVLLIGLSGVAFIFPVGNHYIVEGEKFDLGSNLAQNGFEELVARELLRPDFWYYASNQLNSKSISGSRALIQPTGTVAPGLFNVPIPGFGVNKPGPGHAFVLDPLGADSVNELLFPYAARNISGGNNPWWNPSSGLRLTGNAWPIRRLTVRDTNGFMSTAVAETIFRLRDDLATTQPNQDDLPSIQNWDLDNTTTTPTLLRRQYKGDYSWLATIVPTSSEALAALQPNTANNDYGEPRYDVSVVVFRRREVAPSETSERLIRAEMINNDELVVYGNDTTIVDAALDEIRPGNWIALTGVNQTTGVFMLNWYRILSRDKETVSETNANYAVQSETGDFDLRFLTIAGPDWPDSSYTNLRAIILPGVITVVTHPLHMEDTSLWSFERGFPEKPTSF